MRLLLLLVASLLTPVLLLLLLLFARPLEVFETIWKVRSKAALGALFASRRGKDTVPLPCHLQGDAPHAASAFS